MGQPTKEPMIWIGQPQQYAYSGLVQTRTILIEGRKLVPIPDRLLKQCPLGEDVDVSLVPGGLLVMPVGGKARVGWAQMLAKIPQEQLDRDSADLRTVREAPAAFDEQEWEW